MSSPLELAQPLIAYFSTIHLTPINVGVQILAIALPGLLLSETFYSTKGRWFFKPLASFGFIIAALSYIPSSNSPTSALTSFGSLDEVRQASAAASAITSESLQTVTTAYASELKHLLNNVAPAVASCSLSTLSAAYSNTTTAMSSHSTYTQAMLGAFILGFIGDVLLIPHRGFLPGLVSFLLGHAAFMVAFTFHGQDQNAQQLGLGFIVAMAAIVGPWLLPQIKNPIMRGAVVAYMFVISGMVITAVGSVNCGQTHLPERILGALMFFFSDLFVARQHFVQKTVLNKWIGLPLYYIGQILLASTLRAEH
ncbi:hypothetical protein BGW38_003489 [Lunasporangiospora selenospora]|uniref:YhhN-like protein n=1 Tax=Lunasporangiospora selenospora TaxID=979761 RepID=A0A9P6FSP0_9FUNG|nr:hypothetical protein BGW38_003489 [Lunasporangiospora selenospora]